MRTDAPRVLLIHGRPGSALIWTRVLPRLRAYGLCPFAVDRAGDRPPDGDAIDQFENAASLAGWLDEQRYSPAVIVAHGLGAGVALALAATAPRHVRALVLVAPAAGPQSISVTDRLLAAPILGSSLAWVGFRAAGVALHVPVVRRRILSTRLGLSASDAKHVARHLICGAEWRSVTIEQRRLVGAARRLHHGLSRLTGPVLIVAGTGDRLASPRTVEALRRRLPGSEVITTDTGHLVPIDDPDAVAGATLRALIGPAIGSRR